MTGSPLAILVEMQRLLPGQRRGPLLLLPVLLAAVVWLVLTRSDSRGASSAATPTPAGLTTAISDEESFAGAEGATALRLTRAAGSGAVRLSLYWANVAPSASESEPPSGFVASNPADSHYRWTTFDRQVREAVAAGLQPIVTIESAPMWAQGRGRSDIGPVDPDPAALADFVTAAATRYGGDFRGLPRVRNWEVWNEPNISPYLWPQYDHGQPVSAAWFRQLLNHAAAAIHAVHSDNLVIAGALSPFTVDYGDVESVGPLRFMRDLLCLSAGAHPRPTCSDKVEFDVWSHHPYTSGGPYHHAANANDVSLGDLGKMRKLLDAAAAAGHIVSEQPVRFWVTEFSWDSKPPDPRGVPMGLYTRWVSESLYVMWRAGVSLATWFKLQDEPLATSSYQSGFYYASPQLATARAKPSLAAFRFPTVAYRRGAGIYVWSRTPAGRPARVVFELDHGHGWTPLGAVRTGSGGIASTTFPLTATRGRVRARIAGGPASPGFSLTRPPDRIVRPFG